MWLQRNGTRGRARSLSPSLLYSGGVKSGPLLFLTSISPSAKWVYTQALIHMEATMKTVLTRHVSQAPAAGPAGCSAASPPGPAATLAFRAAYGMRCGQVTYFGNEVAEMAHVTSKRNTGNQSVTHLSFVSCFSTSETSVG